MIFQRRFKGNLYHLVVDPFVAHFFCIISHITIIIVRNGFFCHRGTVTDC